MNTLEKALKKVYAVIVTWNGTSCICRALESLRQSSFSIRIIVVDNASTDKTVETIRERYKEVTVFCMPSNKGFAQANNYGIRHALSQGADCVFLINQDAYVYSDTIERLVSHLDEREDLGILSPLHLDCEGSDIDPKFVPYLQESTTIFSDALLGRLKDIYEVSFVNAAAWMVRRRVFKMVGGFDPLFFMYGEDNDFCQRVLYHGFKIGIASKVFACHQHEGIPYESITFNEMTNRLLVQFIQQLKRPDRHFVRNSAGLWIGASRMVMHMLIEGTLRRSFAALFAASKVATQLSVIKNHHALCRHPDGPWLEKD